MNNELQWVENSPWFNTHKDVGAWVLKEVSVEKYVRKKKINP